MKLKIFKVIISLILAHHVAMTILFLSPNNPLTNLYSDYNRDYIEHFFYQSWALFAPEPPLSRNRIVYKCGEARSWIDPSEKVLQKHHSTRVLGNGKMLYMYRNVARELLSAYFYEQRLLQCTNKDTVCLKKASVNVKKSASWSVARKLMLMTCAESAKNGLIKGTYGIVVEKVKGFSEKNEDSPSIYIDDLIFLGTDIVSTNAK